MLIIKMLGALVAAWDMLIGWPLPEKLRKAEFNRAEDGELLALAFPMIGLVFGFLLFACGAILIALFGPAAGAVAFAVLAVVLSEFRAGGAFSLFVSAAAAYGETGTVAGALGGMGGSWRHLNGLVPTLAALLYLGLKLVCFALLAWFHSRWLMPVFALGFAAQGYLAALPPERLIELDASARYHVWLPAVFVLLFFIGHPAAPLVSFALIFGGAVWFGGFCRSSIGGVDASAVTLFGAVAELATLAVGVLALF